MFSITVEKKPGFARAGENTKYFLDGKACGAVIPNAGDGKVSINTTDGYAVLDYSGNVLINPGTYKPIRAFNSGIAWAKNSSDQYVGIDEKGNVVIS